MFFDLTKNKTNVRICLLIILFFGFQQNYACGQSTLEYGVTGGLMATDMLKQHEIKDKKAQGAYDLNQLYKSKQMEKGFPKKMSYPTYNNNQAETGKKDFTGEKPSVGQSRSVLFRQEELTSSETILVDATRLSLSGDVDGAIKKISEAIDNDPDFAKGYEKRGEFYMKINNWESAIADFTKMIELNPNNHKGYILRAQARKKSGDEKGAQEDFNAVRKLRLK